MDNQTELKPGEMRAHCSMQFEAKQPNKIQVQCGAELVDTETQTSNDQRDNPKT